MKIYVPDHGHVRNRDYCEANGIGMLYSPHRNLIPQAKEYIIDNGAYPAYLQGKTLDLNKFYGFLGKCLDLPNQPRFVNIPDIVAGGSRSFSFSVEHLGKIPEQYRKYFVVQDGMMPALLEDSGVIQSVDGLFVGGSTVWKWRTARQWVDCAHNAGIQCHIGRVGNPRNWTRAENIGADSCDGSTPVRHRRLWQIPLWERTRKQQKTLELGS